MTLTTVQLAKIVDYFSVVQLKDCYVISFGSSKNVWLCISVRSVHNCS